MASVQDEVNNDVSKITGGGIGAEIAESLRQRVRDVCRRGGKGAIRWGRR